MTDTIAALGALSHLECAEREQSLERFYKAWKHDALVIDKWFAIQAAAHHPQVLQHVKTLLKHPDFDILNPNRVFSIFRNFTHAYPLGFHHKSGEGYRIVADYILKIDAKNAQVAARIARLLSRFKQFEPARQALMRQELERVAAQAGLSRDVFEVVSNSLAVRT